MKIIKNISILSLLTIAFALSTNVHAIDWASMRDKASAKIDRMFGNKQDWQALGRQMQEYAKSRNQEALEEMRAKVAASKKLTNEEKERLGNIYNQLVKNMQKDMAHEEAYRKETEEYKERKMKNMFQD